MHVFSRLKLRNKALLAPAFLLVAGAGLTVCAVERHSVEMTRERKATVATMVAAAEAVTAHFADEEASGRLTRKAAMLAARDVISRMRLGSGQDVVLGPGAASGVPPGGQVVDWPNQAALPEPVGFVRPNLKVIHHAGTANPPIMAGGAEEAAQIPAQDPTAAPGQWDVAIDTGS